MFKISVLGYSLNVGVGNILASIIGGLLLLFIVQSAKRIKILANILKPFIKKYRAVAKRNNANLILNGYKSKEYLEWYRHQMIIEGFIFTTNFILLAVSNIVISIIKIKEFFIFSDTSPKNLSSDISIMFMIVPSLFLFLMYLMISGYKISILRQCYRARSRRNLRDKPKSRFKLIGI